MVILCLQETILRLRGLKSLSEPIIVCNTNHRFLVADQCQQINIKNPTILLEPVGRNTAPAILASALQSLKNTENAVLLILSADHVIRDIEKFHQAINIGINQAEKGKLVTFGIMPNEANTEYGYIKVSESLTKNVYNVDEFVEKPDLPTAKSYLNQGNYLWNSGMFVFDAISLIDELTSHSPDIVKSVRKAVDNSLKDLDFIRLDKKAFESSPSNSIDYALMEKSDNVVVIPLDIGWSDVGSWSALYDVSKKDKSGNVLKGDVTAKDTTNTYIHASNHLVATVGVDNLVVVDTPDATFIASQDKAHLVKSVVESIQKKRKK